VTELLRSGHMLKVGRDSTRPPSRASSPCWSEPDARSAAERTDLLRQTALVDMRNGIDGLRALVEGALKKDPYGGHLFVFVGKSKDKMKILFWDRDGGGQRGDHPRSRGCHVGLPHACRDRGDRALRAHGDRARGGRCDSDQR
jgi:hypothetical protein